MKKIQIILIIFISLISCNLENRKPEYKRFENVEILEFSTSRITISGDVVIFNPNEVSAILTKTEIDVYANDIKVSHISQSKKTEITKNSEFNVPLNAKFKPQDLIKNEGSILDILNSSLNAYKEKNIDLKFVGNLTFEVLGVKFDVPIEYEEKVTF